jgi:tetratricopeptide (TPR) repeat protein
MLGPRHTTLWAGIALTVAACAPASVTERARSLVRQNRDAEAIAVLRSDLGSHPSDLAARRLLIRVLGASGDLVAARAQVEELERRVPKGDPRPLIELGHALELAHRYDDALEAYDQAAQIAPSAPDGPREGGMRCARWGEASQARPRLEEAIRRGARDAEVWHVLGLTRLSLGDLDGADAAYRNGAAAHPGDVANWLGLASVAMARRDAKGALDAYDAVLARAPSYAAGELGRAWALASLGRTEEAERALDRASDMGAPQANLARLREALDHGVFSAQAEPDAGR